MTIVEILKAMGGSDERICRAVWRNRTWVSIDHDSGTMWFFIAGVRKAEPWQPSCYSLLADDWNFWEMPDDE